MGATDRDNTYRCSRCSRTAQGEIQVRRTGRRTASETRRADIIQELSGYNEKYHAKYGRKIPDPQIREAADLFVDAKKFIQYRNAETGVYRNSILAAFLNYVCRKGTNINETNILEFLSAGGVDVKDIKFSKGDRVLRDLHNNKVAGVNLNINHTQQTMRSNLLLLGLLGTERREAEYPTPPNVDLEGAATHLLEVCEEQAVAPGVQVGTRTLGCIWYLTRQLTAAFPTYQYREFKLNTIAERCKIGSATVVGFQRALEECKEYIDLEQYGIKVEDGSDDSSQSE